MFYVFTFCLLFVSYFTSFMHAFPLCCHYFFKIRIVKSYFFFKKSAFFFNLLRSSKNFYNEIRNLFTPKCDLDLSKMKIESQKYYWLLKRVSSKWRSTSAILQVRDDSSVTAVKKLCPAELLPGAGVSRCCLVRRKTDRITTHPHSLMDSPDWGKKGGAAESHIVRERLLRDMKFTWKARFPTASPLMYTVPHGELRVKPAQAPLWHQHTLT